jgi:tRNA pseudouridine13 synthase
MKLKRTPEDFRVEELPIVRPGDSGRFVLYRLTKTGLGTLEAVEAVRRRWGLAAADIAYGGLKDRHAHTIQYLTILGGPDRALYQDNLELEPVGRLPHPYNPRSFRGNRFSIVLRVLTPESAARVESAVAGLAREGIPNYFDDQRFGSVGESRDFIAEAWLKGDHERALWLALAEPNTHDRPDAREVKRILRETWGRWADAKAALPRSHARSLVTYLVDHPTDFKGAYARLDRGLRSLHFSAFQSHLWNLLLGAWIRARTRPDQREEFPFATAELPIPHDLDPDQAAALSTLALPLPSARQPRPEGEIGDLADAVLTPRGLAWPDLRVRGLKDLFLSKGDRAATLVPAQVGHARETDDLYPGREKIALAFELPRGAYATMVVKRITLDRTAALETEADAPIDVAGEASDDEPAGG